MNKTIHLTQEQYDILYKALSFHYNYLSQPNEMAVDFSDSRKKLYKLMEYLDATPREGIKRYKLTNGKWELFVERL